jgi:hypothetical protein
VSYSGERPARRDKVALLTWQFILQSENYCAAQPICLLSMCPCIARALYFTAERQVGICLLLQAQEGVAGCEHAPSGHIGRG